MQFPFPCEGIVLAGGRPYLALFFNDQDIYWRLHRNLVGTPAGIDFVDHLWDYPARTSVFGSLRCPWILRTALLNPI